MKYLLFILFSLFIKISISQITAGPLGTNSLTNNSASGSSWGISSNSFAGCSMGPFGFSKGLIAKKFNFSIPASATIIGVEAAFSYSSTIKISDTIIKLVVNNIETGNNKSTNTLLAGLSTTYGASTDLWGVSTLSPSNINSPNFGFVIYVKNSNSASYDLNAMPSTTTGITFVMTVYYTNFSGIIESQVSTSDISLYPQPTKDLVNINLINSYNKNIEAKIIDITGKEIEKKELEVNQGKAQFSTLNLPNGIYIIQLKNSQGQVAVKRLVVSK